MVCLTMQSQTCYNNPIGDNMQNFRYFLPTDVRFGEDILHDETLYTLPYKRVLIVTTKNISSARYGALETLQSNFETQGIETVLYDKVTRPLTTRTILDAAHAARDYEVDAIVAHGGAKVIDAAKLAARMAHEHDAYLSGWLESKHVPPFESDALSVIAVPTSLTLVASLNHKVYIYDASLDRYERLKHPSFTPSAAWIDPKTLSTLPFEVARNAVSDVLIRAFELIRLNVSPLHTDVSSVALRRLFSHAKSAIMEGDMEDWSALAYAHVLVGSLYVKKPYFPLHMINDTVQGFHPDFHYARFIFFAAPVYLSHQIDQLDDDAQATIRQCFKNAGQKVGTLPDAFAMFFSSLNENEERMQLDAHTTRYPEDYLVHLKTLFPKFSALKDQVVYRIIEDTMLK